MSWQPLDALTVNLGGRYTEESKDYTFIRVDKNTGLPDTTPYGPAFLVAALNGAQSHYEGNKTDYRAAVDYRWTPELLTYASVSTGFKGGGVNPRPFDDLQARPFGPETMTAYEIGAKTDLLAHTLRVNLSAFFNQYRDIVSSLSSCPQFSRPGTVACSVLVNGGDGQFRGVGARDDLCPGARVVVRRQLQLSRVQVHQHRSGRRWPWASARTAVGYAVHHAEVSRQLRGQYEIALGGAGSFTPRVECDVRRQGSTTPAIPSHFSRNTFPAVRSPTLASRGATWHRTSKPRSK